MRMSDVLVWLMDSGATKLLPARIGNWLYRKLVGQLIAESKQNARPSEILDTPPIPCSPSSHLKVATLVSSKDIEMLIWALKSLFYYSKRDWDLLIIDGGLTSSDETVLLHHFPNARIFFERDLVKHLADDLDDFPLLKGLRFKNPLAKKIVDAPKLLGGQKFLLLDSDVLFFRTPVELVDLLENPAQQFAFCVDQLGINSGVAVIPGARISFPELEGLLVSMTEEKRAGWQVEQDLYALLSKTHFQRLPESYAIEPAVHLGYESLVCCHFVHVCRHRFYEKGIEQLRKMNFIESLLSTPHGR
jgi:hypothetical protein